MAMRVIDVKSPCVGNCWQNQDIGLCRGCYRTSHEKLKWREMMQQTKLDTLILCDLRKDKLGDISTKGGISIHYAPAGR